jgi:archaellum biogenesis ATPase FlaH
MKLRSRLANVGGGGAVLGIEEMLTNISSGSIMILEFPAETNQVKLVSEFLKFKRKTNSYGVYVSTNRPTNNLIEKVRDYGYDLKEDLDKGRVWIVDLISRNVGNGELKGVIYVSSASELSATQMAIEKAMTQIKENGGQGWLLLDSIATMLVFNSPNSLLEFLHFLLGRLRVLGFDGLIFTVREGIDEKVISTIRQFCDAIIKL